MSNGNGLVSINMTSFFHREIFMYSLGDIKFKKPIALKKVAYTTFFLIAWALPLILIFGIVLNVFFALIVIAPPIFMGHFASTPRFGGMSLPAWIKNVMSYVSQPKGWADLEPFNDNEGESNYRAEHEMWISRRRELQILADLREDRNKGLKV